MKGPGDPPPLKLLQPRGTLKGSIISLLENVMHEKKLNQSEFSKLLEIPDSTLSGILSGKRKISINIARKLHDKLRIDGNSILESD
jgi:HTH-type transcriptional regulator / antitoxin HigA